MSTSNPNTGALKALDYAVVQQCMHCGMCLPTCPTYEHTQREGASPRGRIAMMRAIADGHADVSLRFADEMAFCLGCLACETACPAGVDYTQLFESARAHIETSGVRHSRARSLLRLFLMRWLFTSRYRLRGVGRILRGYQQFGGQALVRRFGLARFAGKRLAELEPLTPTISHQFSPIPYHSVAVADSAPKYRVALVAGCVQDIAFADVNRDTITVLEVNGCAVTIPEYQQCCGSLHAHNGDVETAKTLARRNLDAFDLESIDAVIINAAGCGSHIRHYDRLLADDAVYSERAKHWSSKVRDVSEFLSAIGFRHPTASPFPTPATIAYHEACHLVHGQKVSAQPREILASLPGATIVELPEATWCCGSAGIYNITQPEMSRRLCERKLTRIRSTGATIVATGNPGCILQLETGARLQGMALQLVHPISLLASAYRAEVSHSSSTE